MAKKEKKEAKATKKAVEKAKKVLTPEQEAKKAARKEAIKNRPAEQRPNSKQIDVIDLGDGNVVKNYGYAVKRKNKHVGVVVTSVAIQDGKVVSTSVTFVPGDLTIKCKKNHGVICAPKSKGEKDDDIDEVDDTEKDTTSED